jgi:hypothetical protein
MSEGRSCLKKSNLRLIATITSTYNRAPVHKIFSRAAYKLAELVTSTPRIGLNKNVDAMYGALHAIQK